MSGANLLDERSESKPGLGKTYADDNVLRFVSNIYAVLLTHGIKVTYVYVGARALPACLARQISAADSPHAQYRQPERTL